MTEMDKYLFDLQGYFIERNVISRDLACEMRGVIMLPAPGEFADVDPMNPITSTTPGHEPGDLSSSQGLATPKTSATSFRQPHSHRSDF